MKLSAATVLAAALVLSLVPVAVAKDLTQAQVCGQSGCAALPRNEDGDGLIQLRGSEGRPLAPPPESAPYYRLIWEFGRPAKDGPSVRFATLYVPAANLVAAPGRQAGSVEWFGASEAVLEKVRTAARNLEPFAAPGQWPSTIEASAPPSSTASIPASGSREWMAWGLAAAVAIVFIGVAAFLARRLRRRAVATA